MEARIFPSVAFFVIMTWPVLEAVALMLPRHRSNARNDMARFLRWAARPWAAWAAINILHRLAPHGRLCNPETFPFYANRLSPDLGAWQEFARVAGSGAFWIHGTALAVLSCLLCWVAWCACRETGLLKKYRIPLLTGMLAVTILLSFAAGSFPCGATASESEYSSLLEPWRDPGSTYLYGLFHAQGSVLSVLVMKVYVSFGV